MKVRYSPRATDDLIAIADYLTERSPSGARNVEAALRKTIGLLSEFSGGGGTLTQRPSVRVIPLARYPYLIFYTATVDEILILHIRHGARAPVEPGELGIESMLQSAVGSRRMVNSMTSPGSSRQLSTSVM
jgi:toxin ParE1/3/4